MYPNNYFFRNSFCTFIQNIPGSHYLQINRQTNKQTNKSIFKPRRQRRKFRRGCFVNRQNFGNFSSETSGRTFPHFNARSEKHLEKFGVWSWILLNKFQKFIELIREFLAGRTQLPMSTKK